MGVNLNQHQLYKNNNNNTANISTIKKVELKFPTIAFTMREVAGIKCSRFQNCSGGQEKY